MIKNFCDRCGREIPLDNNARCEFEFYTVDRNLVGCGKEFLALELCTNCEGVLKNILDKFKNENVTEVK